MVFNKNMAFSNSINSFNFLKQMFNQIIRFKNFSIFNNVNAVNYSSEVSVTAAPMVIRKQTTSKAMKAYLERALEHDEFIKSENLHYQIGKRHLANMMGEDPETFSQEEVNNAIEYLFPSGLFQISGRPIMKPPEGIFSPKKAAEFDATGRPYHSMFYTGRPNFFKLLYEIVEEINKLNDFEDKMIRKGIKFDPNRKLEVTGFEWISKDQLTKQMVENLVDIEYLNFIQVMDRLVSSPYSYKAEEFINNYRRRIMDKNKSTDIPKPQIDKNGRQFVTTYECLRKKARGDVILRYPGTGIITINGQDITYFKDLQSREQASTILIIQLFVENNEKFVFN